VTIDSVTSLHLVYCVDSFLNCTGSHVIVTVHCTLYFVLVVCKGLYMRPVLHIYDIHGLHFCLSMWARKGVAKVVFSF